MIEKATIKDLRKHLSKNYKYSDYFLDRVCKILNGQGHEIGLEVENSLVASVSGLSGDEEGMICQAFNNVIQEYLYSKGDEECHEYADNELAEMI